VTKFTVQFRLFGGVSNSGILYKYNKVIERGEEGEKRKKSWADES
jgi:hypothetical protein